MSRFDGFESFDIDCQVLFLCYYHQNIKRQNNIDENDIEKYFDELEIKHHSIIDILISLYCESRVPENTLCKKYYWQDGQRSNDCFYYIRPLVNKNLKALFAELGFRD